jgi:preprotein translocase SecF subunit
MFQIIGDTKIDFLEYRRSAAFFSLFLLVACVAGLVVRGGPLYSIDFSGGRLVEIAFEGGTVEVAEVRDTLESIGLSNVEVQAVDAGGAVGEHPGMVLRFPDDSEITGVDGATSPTDVILATMTEAHPEVTIDIRRSDSVGPKIGGELRGKAVRAILAALGAILFYVAIRYEFNFAVGAVAALFHDVIIVFGVLTILGVEMSLPIVAALMTIAGYSINDTIVVFDRIRERRKSESRKTLLEIVNNSINQVLSRTIVTSVTTLFSALALFFFGGPVIHDFSLAIVLGVIIGTYSSIFVATSLAYVLLMRREHRGGGKKKKSPAVAPA